MARPATAEPQEPDVAALAFHASGSAGPAEQRTVEPAQAVQQENLPGRPFQQQGHSGIAV